MRLRTNRWLFRSLSSILCRRLAAYSGNLLISRMQNSFHETWRRFMRFVYSRNFHGKYLDSKEFKIREFSFVVWLENPVKWILYSRLLKFNFNEQAERWNFFFFPSLFSIQHNRTLQQVKFCAQFKISFFTSNFWHHFSTLFIWRTFFTLVLLPNLLTSKFSFILPTQNHLINFLFFFTWNRIVFHVHVCPLAAL